MSEPLPTPTPSAPAVQKVSRLRDRLAVKLIGWIMRAWYATLRVQITPRFEDMCRHYDTTSTVFLLWHNRLFMGPFLYRCWWKRRRVYTIVSASKDGAFASAVAEELGVNTVRGSSSRRALQAVRELLEKLASGDDVVITPDGPRGPLYSMSASAAMLVRRTHARVVLVLPNPRRAWRMKSWDGFYIPKPFTTIDLDCDVLDAGMRAAEIEDDEFCALIKARYDALTSDPVPHPRPEADNKPKAGMGNGARGAKH